MYKNENQKAQVTRYEKNITQEIMKERGRKKPWQLVNTLRGKKTQ